MKYKQNSETCAIWNNSVRKMDVWDVKLIKWALLRWFYFF